MTSPLLLLTLSLSLLLRSTDEQDVNLYRYRQAWLASTTQAERDSIRDEILARVSDLSIDQSHGQDQAALWDECCDQWDVTQLETSAHAPSIQEMPDVQMRTAGDVEFIEGTTGYSEHRDSFFLYSNRYPGYGGLDIYFREYEWFHPRNLGRGLNTASDEYGFRPEGDAYMFVRVVDGEPRWFRAVSRNLVEQIAVHNACPRTTYIMANVNSCRGFMLSSIAFDSDLPVELPPGAHEIILRCCAGAPERVIERCDVTQRYLILEDTDIRVHHCAIAGATTSTSSEERFGFSVYETAASGERAMRFLQEEIVGSLGPHDIVQIAQVPGHLESPLTDLVAAVEAAGARVERTEAKTLCTEITLAVNR